MAALPAIYLLIGELFYAIRQYKLFLAAAVIVLVLFALTNAFDTINKLVVDKTINDVKFASQKYINDNSPQCSQVYSKTWYGFYYLRNRITDLPADLNGLNSIIKSKCSCPPQYFIVEGAFDSKFLNMTTKDRSFQQDSINFHLTWQGITSTPVPIAPVDVYKINDNVIMQQCG